MSNTKPARGMRDFLPSDVRKRNYVINIIKEVYESYGFEPLETPSVENLETLTGKYGEEGNRLIFKILKRRESFGEELDSFVDDVKNFYDDNNPVLSPNIENSFCDLALRYDLTVPLARVAANYKNDLPKFFKRYQIQPVWRADRPARGRFREFYQCDVDAIGSNSMLVEAELCAAVSEILERLGFNDFDIRINHRKFLTAILEESGVPLDKHADALIALDKIDKIGREGVEKEFNQRGINNDSAIKLLTFFEFFLKDKSKEVFDEKQKFSLIDFQKKLTDLKEQQKRLKSLSNTDTTESNKKNLIASIKWLEKSIQESRILGELYEIDVDNIEPTEKLKLARELIKPEELSVLIEILKFTKQNSEGKLAYTDLYEILWFSGRTLAKSHLKIDPSLARGLSYYTGAIFEINVPDLAGSLGGGGRYDGLIGMFGKEQIPACGFSLGLERILVVMEERGMFPAELQANSADVMVTIWNEDAAGESLKLASELRNQNLRVLVYPEADKLGKQFKYADSINIPFVCVLGETELAENKVTLKNMKSGEQETVARNEIAAKIKF